MNLKVFLDNSSGNIPPRSEARLRSIFTDLSRTILCVVSTCSPEADVTCGSESEVVSLSTSWNFKANGLHTNFPSEERGSENTLKCTFIGNPEFRSLVEYSKELLSNKLEKTTEIEKIRPNNGFDAIVYFLYCRKLGVYEFMYFIRDDIKRRNLSPYEVIPISKPKNNSHHYIFSTFGILASTGIEHEHLSLTEWFSEAVLCEALMRNLTFCYLPAWKSFVASPLNIVQFCAQINRNLRYNTIIMLHVIKCIFIAFNYARCTLTKLIHCKEDELDWNSKEINQTSSMTDTWKKGVIIKNELEQLRNHLSNFPNLIHCIRYRLASFILSKFQSSIEDYVCKVVNLEDKPIEETKESITGTHNFRLVIYPVLLQELKERNQLLLWPSPTSLISIFKLTLEQFKNSLHLNKILSENQLTQIYFNEEKEIENINEIVDNEAYANSIIHMFYSNSNLVNLDGLKHTTTIPWDIVNPFGLDAANIYIRDIVHNYLPTYETFERDLIPKQQFHQTQSMRHGLYTDQTRLNIIGHNCFPTLESISQWGLHSLIEQQCEAMNLYGCLMMPWSETIYEKTNNIILSIEWIVTMNETVNELNTILQNEDLHTELHKYQRLFQTSVQWINNLQNHDNLLNDNRSNSLQCFILIDCNPLFNLLRNQLVEKLHKLFSIYIPIVQNSLISINKQLDDFIHTHSNIPPDFSGFMQVATYLNHFHMCHEKLFKDHENLCRQVEFIQHFQKCFIYCNELNCLQLIQLSIYEQFIIKWKKLTNQIEWVRKKFFRYRKEFYLDYKKNIKKTLKEIEHLVHSLTTGKYSDVNYDAQCLLNNMKEPYYRLIKLETCIHQLVDQYKTVQHCEKNEEEREKNQVEKINMFNSHQTMTKIPPALETTDAVKSCRTDFKQTNYFNETNKYLLRLDNEMKKVNCRYDALELKARIDTFKHELYQTKLGEVSLNVINENYQKLVTICNNLQNDDIIVQYDVNCLKVMKTMIKLLSYILDSNLLATISGRDSFRSDALTTKIHYPWIFLNIDNLIEKLCELSFKLQSLLDSKLLNTIKHCETKSSSSLLTNEKEYYLVKRLNQTKNALYNIKLTQDYWLYLYRLYALKQFNEEMSSNQFLELTDNFIQLENHLLSTDHIITNQSIECEDNELLQMNCIDLQSFMNVINSEWELWLTLKDNLYTNVNMFNRPIEEMCETFPLFCLLSNMERISLICNWYIPYYDYAAPPLKCSIQDAIDTQYNSCQYYLNDVTINYGLINLNKWIKRLFPFLINCIMIWCKAEHCWKITQVINEFNQSIPLLTTIKWLPSINQWFIQFYNNLQLTLITITLNLMLIWEKNNKQLMNEYIENKPIINLELTERIIIWQKLENILRKEKKKEEFNKIVEYLEERLNNATELLNVSFTCDKQMKSRVDQLTCQFLIGTILGFIHLIQDLKKEANLNEGNFLWQRLIKTQLINSVWNHKENDELDNVYNEFPMIGIKQFSRIHLYVWNNQSLLLNNNTSYLPLLNTSQELIQLGSALINHEFGLLVGSTGKGKQTIIRQLAFILGRHLLEFTPDNTFNHSNLDTFETRLKNDILICLRIGGHKLIIHHSIQYNSYSKQCLFNQNVRIDCGFGLFGTFDLQSLQNISEVQRITFRIITIQCPNWLLIIKCLVLFYLPNYHNHLINYQLINQFNKLSINQFNNFNYINHYFTISIIIKLFEIIKQFWLEQLKQIQIKYKTTSLTSLIQLNNEKDQLVKIAIIYGLIKVNRIQLSIDINNQDDDDDLNKMNWLLSIEQYLSIPFNISCIDEYKQYFNCINYTYPKITWEFMHRLLREIHLSNMMIINSQLIKIIELWQLIHFNRPILIIGPTASGKSTILKLLISTINSYQYTNREKWTKSLPTLQSTSSTSSSPPSSSSPISQSPGSICTTSSPNTSTLSTVDSKHSVKPDQLNNENEKNDDVHLTLKHTMNIFRIPDELIAYLNKFNLILNDTDSIHFNVYNNKMISLRHLFPYSDEYLTNFCIQNDVNDLYIDTSNLSVEWLLLDLSDQSIDHLTFLDECKIFNLLKCKLIQLIINNRKLFLEKTTIADLSPGLIHRFSLCSVEVNDELLWPHLWRIWCRTSYSKYMIINSVWNKILSELDNLIPIMLDETWEFINHCCYRDVDNDDAAAADDDGTSSLLNMKSYKNAFYQQNIRNLLAIISELLKIYFPKELWELRRNGKRPSSTYQSNIAIIDYYWSEWRNLEDRSEFYEILIRNLFVFSFIWGIGGSFAGDPRLKSRFETILLRVLKDFIKLPVSMNIDSTNNLPPSSSSSSPSSPSTSTLELYYTHLLNHCLREYNCSTTSDNKWSYNKNDEDGETVDILQYSLFSCLVDLRTGYLTPFWYTDSYQLHWPEEYDIIIPGEGRQYTKPLLPTLFHLSVHLFTGSLFIQSDQPVIISGPTGSGKSQLAIAISQNIEQRKVLLSSKQHQQHHRHHKYTRSFRIQSSEFLKRIISNSQINNQDNNMIVQRHKSKSYKMNSMNKLIILEDVHLISKTIKVQRIWNQELRNQLNDHFNGPKSQFKFMPILTTLDDHHKIRTHSYFPIRLNSLMYQFAFIQLTDPCLLFSKEMNINGFLQEQNVYGFNPISLLCQLMIGHELSRISGILVERFSWIIWYMHCSLMKERCIHRSASVDWLTSQKIAHAMGYHLKKLYSYSTTNEILLNCSVMSNNINKHIYSRWAPLMLCESIEPNPKYQSSKILESVLFLCQEVKRYFSPLLPKNSSSEWLFTHLSKSLEYYLIKPSPLGLLIPISYLLFGPSGSLFLNSKITRQSIVHSTMNSPTKSKDISTSTFLHSVYDTTESSSSHGKSFSLTFTTCCSDSTAITSTTVTSVSTCSLTTLLSSNQFHSNNYSSNYSTTSINTSSYDSSVYLCSSSSLPVLSSSMHSLSNLCNISSVTTSTTTSLTSSDNLLLTTPTLSTSTLTNQISFHENNRIVEPHTISDYNEFTKQIETFCFKLNDEIETSLSNCKQSNYSPYYNIKHNKVYYMNHQSWAKYGLLNPHLVPNHLQLINLELKTITNNVDVHPASFLKSFLLNHYMSNISNVNNQSLLCDIFTEAHLLTLQYGFFNQNSYSTLTNQEYSLNYLIQTIHVWRYLEYCQQNKQNNKQLLCNQLNETNLLFHSMKNGYHSLEKQITEANSMLELMKKDLVDYQDLYLPEAKLKYTNSAEQLKYLEEEIMHKENELTRLRKPMDRIKKLAEIEFDKASLFLLYNLKNTYRLAVQGLHNLSIEDLDEIRSYREPPDAVKECVYLICMLMDEEEDWENAKHMMVPVKFISKILKLPTRPLNKHKHHELRRRLTSSETLTQENLLQVSIATARLCEWLRALCGCYDANEHLHNHINEYSSIELQVNNNESTLSNLYLTLQITKLNIELANNHLIECEQQYKHLLENINTLEYKISEAKLLLSTVQNNLSELNNDNNDYVTDVNQNLPFWFNILGALGAVYCQILPTKHRTSLWNHFKDLVWNKMKEINFETRNNQIINQIINKKVLENLQLFKILQIEFNEINKWFIINAKFPFELILTYYNQQINYYYYYYLIEAVLSIRTILWSIQCINYNQYNDNDDDYYTLNKSILYMFIYDPDLIGIDLLKFSLTSIINDNKKKDQMISDICIEAKDFIPNFNYHIHTENIRYLLNFYFNQMFNKNTSPVINSQIILWTSFSETTEIGTKCRQKFSQMELISIDLGLSSLEYGMAFASCLLNVLPNCKVLSSLQELRSTEIDTYEKIYEDKSQLLNISKELTTLKLYHSNMNKSLLTKHNSIQFNADCLNVTKQHIELMKLSSKLSANLMHLKEIKYKYEYLNNQIGMFIYQNNKISSIGSFLLKISLLFNILNELHCNDSILLRWPCKRLCNYITSKYANLYMNCVKDNHEINSSSDLYLCHEYEIQEASRCILYILLEFILNSLNNWHNPLGLIIQIKLCICFNVLQYSKIIDNELHNINHVNEIQLFKQIIYSNIYTNEYDCQHCFIVNQTEVLKRIRLLEEKLPTLHGLEKAFLANPLIWTETNLNSFHSLPGFSTTQVIPESHIYLAWISIRHEMFYVISKEFVNFILAQYITPYDNKEYFNKSFEVEKRLRTDELFQPQIIKPVHGYYSYSDENSFISSTIYLILPNELNEFKNKEFLIKYQSKQPTTSSNGLLTVLHKMAMYSNKTLFSIDCINTTDISYWLSLCGTNTNTFPYQRILLVLRNVHIIDKKMNQQLDELLQYGLYNLRYKQMHNIQNHEYNLSIVNKLGILFDIVIDFTCCQSWKQLVSVYNKLPNWLRSTCLPLLFDCKDNQSLFRISPWKQISLIDRREKPINYQQEDAIESMNRESIHLWLKEIDGLYEKIESDKLYECLYNKEELNKRKHLTKTIWVIIKTELKILDKIFNELKSNHISSTSLSLSNQTNSPFVLLTIQYYAYLRSINYYCCYTKKYTTYNFKLFIWLKHQLIVLRHFFKLMNTWKQNLPLNVVILPATIIINPKSLYDWVMHSTLINSIEQYQLISIIVNPGNKEMFRNGLIITSVRLLVHKNSKNKIINNRENHSNNLFTTTEVLNLRLTTVPAKTFNEMDWINATWIESWPPNEDQICLNIPLLLTNSKEFSKIYIMTDYNL
ncbi:hypothetical protein MN116_004381 [Schistosoma mekongi]|uniref:Uncharacterized protein n=1 Tax=Schistosoma mekongi TaxID=38744 RepID=A0AAE1ZG25_SCHME|nr:hypothetical protein MN116_004381 [Schistosoma mekongi]